MSKEAMKLALEKFAKVKGLCDKHGSKINREHVYGGALVEHFDVVCQALAEQPAQHPKTKTKTKQIAECLAVLRPTVKGKFPHEQALEELVGYIAVPQPAQRKPLTPSEVHGMAEAHGIDGDARHWYVVGLTDGEAKHDIKENT